MTLEGIEPPGPFRSKGLKPGVKFHQRFRTKSVQPSLRIPSDLDQPGITQHLEMTRHTRLMHADPFDQIVHRALALSNRIKDPPPCRFGDHVEHLEGSGHTVIIR